VSLTWPELSRIVSVTVCPFATPEVVPVMSNPALALSALMMLTPAMAMSPAMVLIAIVDSGGGGGAGAGAEGGLDWGISMNP